MTALKGPMKSDTVDTAEKKQGICCRCGVPLTPSKRFETSSEASKAQVERKTKKKNAVVSWQKRLSPPPPLSLVQCFIVERGCQLSEAALAAALGRAFGPAEVNVVVRSVSALGLVAEQARPDADALIVHLCGHDLGPNSIERIHLRLFLTGILSNFTFIR